MIKRVIVRFILIVVLLVPLSTARQTLHAESRTISVALPAAVLKALPPDLLNGFSEAGVNVRLVEVVPPNVDPMAHPDDYLAQFQRYAASADLLFVDSDWLRPSVSRNKLVLALSPLLNSDTAFRQEDFYPAIWNAFAWQHDQWAIPLSASPTILMYAPQSFADAGRAVPNPVWTLDDLNQALLALPAQPALSLSAAQWSLLLRSLLPNDLADDQDTPQLNQAPVQQVIDTLTKLRQENHITLIPQDSPIKLGTVNDLFLKTNATPSYRGVLLPGQHAGLSVQGLALSPGTADPNLAYRVALYLSQQAAFSAIVGVVPARLNLAIQGGSFNVSPDLQTLMQDAVLHGFTAQQMRYSDYAGQAQAGSELAALETRIVQDNALRVTGSVAAVVEPTSTDGTILRFGLDTRWPIDRNAIQQIADSFVAAHPGLSQITLISAPDNLDDTVRQTDCFISAHNLVPAAKLEQFLSLDPYLEADTTFQSDDLIQGIQNQIKRENRTWAYPLFLDPLVLRYDRARFKALNVPEPGNSWSTSAFADALQRLSQDGLPAVAAANAGGTHLLILIAAYGGLPLDYRVDPVRVAFTDPANIQAIRQVLDLARTGRIRYQALANLAFGFGTLDTHAPIYTTALNETADNNHPMTNYPVGEYMGVSYALGAGYIPAQSRTPDLCYAWLTQLTAHPELFNAMPVRRSVITGTALANVVGPAQAAIYIAMLKRLDDQKAVVFPSVYSDNESLSGFLLQYWLYEAFDSYVLHDGSLENQLQTAQDRALIFQSCAKDLPDPSSPDYIKAFGNCATKADGSLAIFFSLWR